MEQQTATRPAESPLAVPVATAQCENCGAPLYGRYCYACGQPVHGLVRHFGSVISDVADSVLNVDERLFRTLGPLYLRPGKLTLDYFAGKRARYVTPFRMVFFLAIVAFFGVQLAVRQGFSGTDRMIQLDTPGATHAPAADPGVSGIADGAFDNGNISINGHVKWNRVSKPLRVSWLPGFAEETLNDMIGNAQQTLRATTSGSRAENQAARRNFAIRLYSTAPTVLFLLLPVFALMLKVMYIFKRRLYMEHLIVTMHSHAFLMLSIVVLLVIGLLRAWLVPIAGWLAVPLGLARAAAWIWVFVYLFLMQKRVYRQGWLMTTLKYCTLGFMYALLFSFGAVFAVLLTLTGA